jgi:hypothetical protein
MEATYAIRKDVNLLKMAVSIFGEDIVETCYITTGTYGKRVEKEIELSLANEAYKKVEDVIDIDAKHIIIKFKNGKYVLFTNSEWGSISNIDMAKCTREV